RIDVGAVQENGRVSAPPAGLGAPFVVLRNRAGLDVIGKEAVVDAHVDFGHGLFDVTVGRGCSERAGRSPQNKKKEIRRCDSLCTRSTTGPARTPLRARPSWPRWGN